MREPRVIRVSGIRPRSRPSAQQLSTRINIGSRRANYSSINLNRFLDTNAPSIFATTRVNVGTSNNRQSSNTNNNNNRAVQEAGEGNTSNEEDIEVERSG